MADQAMILSVVRVLLVFEYYQPNIGYVSGLEKIVFFYRKLTDEPNTFLLLYNTLFNSKLMWSAFEGKKTLTELNLQVLEKMCSKNAQIKESYRINKLPFEKFLLEYGVFLYLDVFDFNVVE